VYVGEVNQCTYMKMLTFMGPCMSAGSFGCVFKGVRGGVQDVAVKVLNISTPDAKERQAFEKVRRPARCARDRQHYCCRR